MKKILFIIILVNIPFFSNAQSIEKKLEEFIKKSLYDEKYLDSALTLLDKPMNLRNNDSIGTVLLTEAIYSASWSSQRNIIRLDDYIELLKKLQNKGALINIKKDEKNGYPI